VQRFLCHAKEAECDVPGDLLQAFVGVKHDLDFPLVAKLAAGSLERRDEPEVMKHRGVQLVRQIPDRLGRSERLFLQAGELLMRLREV
jgi:hypothetical protein